MRVMKKAQTNRNPPPFTPRQAMAEAGVGQMCEPELHEKGSHHGVNIRGFWEEKVSREGECLIDGEQREASVVLRDVGGELAEQGRVEW